MDNLRDGDYRYHSDDSRKGAELVATRLHGIKLTEEGGNDDSENVVDVRHLDGKSRYQSLIWIYE